MIRMRHLALTGLLGLGVAIGSTVTSYASNNTPNNLAESHPEIRRALESLHEAKRSLESADRDFAGHRKSALADTDAAISECETCLTVDR